MSKQIDDQKCELIHKIDDIPRRNFKDILPGEPTYKSEDIVNAADLRRLLKLSLGSEAELKPEHYQAISNRKTLLRLQNNIKQRQVDKHNFLDAIITLDSMRQIAPDEAELLLDAGQLYAQANQPRAAINALSSYLSHSPSQYGRTKASVLMQQMKRQLN